MKKKNSNNLSIDGLSKNNNTESNPTPTWYKIIMISLMVIGLLWVVVYYISGSLSFPIPSIKEWNIALGFGIAFIGFIMTTNWK